MPHPPCPHTYTHQQEPRTAPPPTYQPMCHLYIHPGFRVYLPHRARALALFKGRLGRDSGVSRKRIGSGAAGQWFHHASGARGKGLH